MDITNKTRKPVSVPLPAGKKLFLGPGKKGQISPKAAEFPAVQALVESGDVEIYDPGGKGKFGEGTGGGVNPSGASGGAGGVRHTGDR